jgi:hypothetical protein
MTSPFTVAVFADTHIRPEPLDTQAGYPSDAEHNERARRAVRMVAQRHPRHAIHLGDITHTLPSLPTYDAAMDLAQEVFRPLPCPLAVAPGNHDVGDKPDSHATAPRVDAESCRRFEERWGPSWQSWDHGGCHFVVLNSALFNADSELERAQGAWLAQDLPDHERIFVFMHYPPFILEPDEPSHYDNVAEPARSWLLAMFQRHHVEAVFSGHAHTVFLGRIADTRYYTIPSTAFVRPEYSELFAVGPADENGRNDTDKLGLVLLHIDEDGHHLELVRTATDELTWEHPSADAGVGVWMRGGWDRVVSLPCGDLDEFRRKRARDDYPVLAALDLRIRRLRIPLTDLDDPVVRQRVRDLAALGFEFVVFHPGMPGRRQADLIRACADGLIQLEVLAREGDLNNLHGSPPNLDIPLSLSCIDDGEHGKRGYFSHFPTQGFSPSSDILETALGALPAAGHLVFRIPPGESVYSGVEASVERATALDRFAVCHLELARGTERQAHTNDEAVARRVADGAVAARAFRSVHLFVDTFVDKDRGYYPRHGLVDRRGNLRPSACVLRNLCGALGTQTPGRTERDGIYVLQQGELHLAPQGVGPWLDLSTRRVSDDAPRYPAIRLG